MGKARPVAQPFQEIGFAQTRIFPPQINMFHQRRDGHDPAVLQHLLYPPVFGDQVTVKIPVPGWMNTTGRVELSIIR
jgi:hypothetical protein